MSRFHLAARQVACLDQSATLDSSKQQEAPSSAPEQAQASSAARCATCPALPRHAPPPCGRVMPDTTQLTCWLSRLMSITQFEGQDCLYESAHLPQYLITYIQAKLEAALHTPGAQTLGRRKQDAVPDDRMNE